MLQRSLQEITTADLAAGTCEKFSAVFSDYPVHGIAPPAPSREEGVACDITCAPGRLPKPCVPHASACEALNSLGDWCPLHFPTGMGLARSSSRHKRGAPALGSNCPKDTGGTSASVGLVAFFL